MARTILKDVIGMRFGRWTVLDELPSQRGRGATYRMVYVRCQCGRERVIRFRNLQSGTSRSCGCGIPEARRLPRKHGRCHTAEYRTWIDMKHRCHGKGTANPVFANYRDRGIAVCDRWQESFVNFLADMGEKPSPQHSLERVNNSLGYSPANCRWATHAEQHRNTRANINITYQGETLCLSEWAKRLQVPIDRLSRRIAAGWDFETAITRPPGATQTIKAAIRATRAKALLAESAGRSAGLLF